MLVFIFLTFLHSIRAYGESDNYIFEYNHPKNCKSNEYFDIKSFSCIECDEKRNLEPSENGVTCVCNKYSKKIGFEYNLPKCELCPVGTVLTSDRKSCIPCRKVDNLTCNCAINEIRVEREINGDLLKAIKCIQCSENSYPSSDGLRCLSCNNATTSSHANCACPITTHVRIEDYCFHKNEIDLIDIRNTYLVQFSSESIDSYYFRKELRLSAYLCKDGDNTACEHLSNMCALTLSDKSVPCKLSKTQQNPDYILWMFYEEDGYPIVANDKIIPVKYTLDKNDANNRLNFTIATFALNGELKYIDTPNLFCTFLNDVRFGVNVNKQCRIYAKELTAREILFFLPYLQYNEKGKAFLSTLPVFIKNKGWQPLKKFFLIDSISSYRAMPNLVDDSFKKDDELSILRYMKSLEILIKVQNDHEGGHIYSPLVIIEYGELKRQDIQDNIQIKVDYKVIFLLTNKNVNNSIEIAIGVLSGFALAYSALKTWSYCKRNYNGVLRLGVVVWFFIYCLGAIGNVLLLVTTSVCVYTFIFYKGQTVLHILLPTDSVETKIYSCTIIAFCFKITEISALIYRHRKINVFFIDWEQPRTIQIPMRYDSPHTSLKKLYNNRFEEGTRTPLSARSKKRSNDDSQEEHEDDNNKAAIVENHTDFYGVNEADRMEKNQLLPVSIWRTYFVANEWFKIQTKRRVNVALQIIFTLFMLEIVGLKYWTQATPELQVDQSESHSSNEKNFTLRFGVGALVYMFCYCVQWMTSVVFYERYIKNRMQHFVDLCSVANISIFIFAYDYYGYYIHGRSVHGYADTDLETLIDDLKKEENNLCAHRGLIPGTTDQTFIVSLSSSFREIYHKLLDLQSTGESRFSRRNILGSINWEKSLQTHSKIKKFLTAFIDHCFKDLDYVIKDRLLLEKLCDIEVGRNDDQSTFYIDKNNSFDRVIFYGNEWTFGTFEIALFIFVQALSEDYILACMVNLLISQMIITICRINGKTNLAKKTLIDERFLM
ncbi:meckelin [Phymastichus coffea]|uniref:meckelin n=1 Tax=Phymastichus coffea TaxID=108790 RepID=UPI00273BAB61|nr:meckelin [Phymastichus coffea]